MISNNRKMETIKSIFLDNIKKGTHIKTDGYPYYPPAVNMCNNTEDYYTHETVNHSEGFTNEDGTHTNNIENLWSHLRYCWRERKGVVRYSLHDFLYEFIFFKLYIDRSNRNTVKKGFLDMVKDLLKFLEYCSRRCLYPAFQKGGYNFVVGIN